MDNVHLLTYIQQQGRRIKIAFALQRLTAQRHPRPCATAFATLPATGPAPPR